MSDRIFNFGAGPGVLPESVLHAAQRDLWNVASSGIGIAEHSHRGKVFDAVIAEAERECRELGSIGDEYEVLFLQGGASLQFAMVPMNFLSGDATADYIVTGVWSEKAVKEAALFGKVHEAGSSKDRNHCYIPSPGAIHYSGSPVYVHYTSNNTIYGTQWRTEPVPPAGVPLVCDASSDIFSRPIDVSRYALIYAGAQKNLGPSGVTLVIIRKDLVEKGSKSLATMLQYRTFAKNKSLYNTPPTFGVYMMGQVFRWIREQGGLAAMEAINEEKARILYDYLDGSRAFRGTADPEARSRMNVCFRLGSEALEKAFLAEAARRGFEGLKGHRAIGGIRASIYNAMPKSGCEALVAFMREFEKANPRG
ncbi:MAG TPA: 3-phosphoserine/phosphohydroxythreonine transaminase [Gemmatimonadales bacterium]|nr:3-phosphoserine/phosphohydroxythreonine transaminase [Gemmatimonadales bacterium]